MDKEPETATSTLTQPLSSEVTEWGSADITCIFSPLPGD